MSVPVTAPDRIAAEWPPPRGSVYRRRSVPPALAQFMRPLLDELTADITDEVQRRIAEYGPGPDGVNMTSTRLVISQAVTYFVNHIEDPLAPRDQLDETLRRLGRAMAFEGRRLEALRSAFHIGAGLAWKRLHAIAARRGLPAAMLGDIGDDLFDYIDSLGEQSSLGFHEAQTQLTDAAHQWRQRVLELILAGQAAPSGELAARAAAGGWVLPQDVVLVAISPNPAAELPSVRLLHPSALGTMYSDRPVVLLSAPVTPELRNEIEVLFADHRIAVGCEVPLADAASSLRWARRALELAEAGLIADEAVIDCRAHIGMLWIHAEPMLADIVVRSSLQPLFSEPRHSRRILGQTLLHWISTQNPSAPAMAEALGVHPQTIRYRLKRLRDIFGSSIDDPRTRLEMFFALRATGPQWNDGEPAPD